MSNRSKLKVGLIGTGGIAEQVHIPGWKKINGAEIVAVADVNEAAARRIAEKEGISQVFTDFEELLKKAEVDVVDICTPNRFHVPAAMAALESERHVLCEKPLAVSAAEVVALGTLADRKGLKLMTAQHCRYSSSMQAIKQWAAGGSLGEVYHARVRATRRAFLPPRAGFIDKSLSGGGPCMDIGVHALDACLWVMDFPKPVRVSGTMKTNFAKGTKIPGRWGEWDREIYNVEDFSAGFVHFDNGATLTLEASWLGHQEEDEDVSFQLFGKEAGIHWPPGRFSTVSCGTFIQGNVTPVTTTKTPHHEEIAAFYDCVVNDKPSPVPWTETVSVIAILEALARSSECGSEVAVCY